MPGPGIFPWGQLASLGKAGISLIRVTEIQKFPAGRFDRFIAEHDFDFGTEADKTAKKQKQKKLFHITAPIVLRQNVSGIHLPLNAL